MDTPGAVTGFGGQPMSTTTKELEKTIECLRAENAALRDKALRFDLDQAAIESRENDAVELVELRATNAEQAAKIVELTHELAEWKTHLMAEDLQALYLGQIAKLEAQHAADAERIRELERTLADVLPESYRCDNCDTDFAKADEDGLCSVCGDDCGVVKASERKGGG
jgi:hypothetical protein